MTDRLINSSLYALSEIVDKSKEVASLIVVGMAIVNTNKLFNCAVVINKGKILGIVPKSYIPGYKEFYETRWFASSNEPHNEWLDILGQRVLFSPNILFKDTNNKNLIVGVEICEDLWMAIPPSSKMALAGATILCNLSASNALVTKSEYRRDLIKNQSARCIAGYLYASSGTGESTTDIVFDAHGIISENGHILSESKRFLRENQIVYSEIDVDKLASERVRINTFSNYKENFNFVEFESSNQKIEITREISSHPFIPTNKKRLIYDVRRLLISNLQGLAS